LNYLEFEKLDCLWADDAGTSIFWELYTLFLAGSRIVERGKVKVANYEGEMQEAAKEMQSTEEAILATGFSPEQWDLIKGYIMSALKLSNYAAAASHTKENQI
jgi:hypothetical protein